MTWSKIMLRFVKKDVYWIIKVGLSHPKNCFICFHKSSLKIMKSAFYFTLKALFVLKVFQFLCWLFGRTEKTAWLKSKLKSCDCCFLSNFFSPNYCPSKTMKKNVFFHLKSFFRSQDIQIFVICFPSFPHFPDSKGQMEVE